MRNPPRFRIPLGWGSPPTKDVPFVEQLLSDTLVLPIGQTPLASPRIERIHGSWSPHIPEKTPCYRIWSNSYYGKDRYQDVNTIRLVQAQVGTYVLVEMDVDRTQRCIGMKDVWHGVFSSDHPASAQTICGEGVYIDTDVASHWTRRVPDCPKCLELKRIWARFKVCPYDTKRAIVKQVDKEALVLKRRARLPTAFDRVLDDDFLEKPSYKPEPVRPVLPEEDPVAVYDEDARERRLAAARDRNQRIKAAQKELKGR